MPLGFWSLPPTLGQVLSIVGLRVILGMGPGMILKIPKTRGEADDLLIELNKRAEVELRRIKEKRGKP